MEKYWVQAETKDGRLIGYGVYVMGDSGPECYEAFAGTAVDPVEALKLANEYCDERNDPRNDPWWPWPSVERETR